MKYLINLLLFLIFCFGKIYAQTTKQSVVDSLAITKLQGINAKIDSLLQIENFGLAEVQKIDSLQTKKEDFIKKLDSLKELPNQLLTRMDSLITGKLHQISSKLDSAHSKVNQYRDKASKITGNSDVNAWQSKMTGKAEKLKGKTTLLPEKEKLSIPATDLDVKDIPLPGDYKQEIEELKGLTDKQLQEVRRLKAMKKASDRYRELSETADSYKKEVQEIASGDSTRMAHLSKKLEQQAENLEEIAAFKSETHEFEEAQKLAEQLKKENYMKENARKRVLKLAKEGLAKFQNNMKEAQQKMAKFKKKYVAIPSSTDMSKATKRNSLAGKPLNERVTVGGNFQILRGNPISADLSPLIGFKWTKKWSLGVGANYRARLGKENKLSYTVDQDVLGYYSFAEYRLIKGFYLHAAFERMGTKKNPKTENGNWKWANGAIAGLGKSYKLTKKIKGNAQILYNFLYQSGRSPYPSAWMLKTGFQLNNLAAFKKN